jgi:hypothetical protein
MFYDLIEERIKGFTYAYEPQRVILFDQNRATFRGGNGVHMLKLRSGERTCDCARWGRLLHGDGPRGPPHHCVGVDVQ